jgi:hypothetical protein
MSTTNWWRITCRHHLNLFEMAIERIEEMVELVERIDAEREFVESCVVEFTESKHKRLLDRALAERDEAQAAMREADRLDVAE